MRTKRQAPQDVVNEVDAVIQLTGGVLQSLFSVAYTEDVRKVVNRIDKIDEDLKKDIGSVKSNQDSLNKRTVSSLNNQDSKMRMVEKMARTVERKVSQSYHKCISRVSQDLMGTKLCIFNRIKKIGKDLITDISSVKTNQDSLNMELFHP